MIDPRAIVSPDAKLGKDVDIGAYSIINVGVEIEEGTWIGPHVVINGPTRIGRDNKIYQFASVGDAPQDKKYAGEVTRLEIGAGNVIREYCTINRGTAQGGGVTRVGNDNWIMAYVHIAHDCQVGNYTVFANCASLAGHVDVGDYAVLGGFTLVHQFCSLGTHCFCAMNSVVTMDVPPFITVSGHTARPRGINSEGLRRCGLGAETQRAVREAYRILYKSKVTLPQALVHLRALAEEHPEIGELVCFLEHSKRGIVR